MTLLRNILIIMMACLPWTNAQAAISMLVTSVSDINLPTWSLGDPAVQASMDMCVYATAAPAGGYAVTVSAPGGFVLQNGTQTIPYSLSWDDGGAGGLGVSAAPLTNGVKLSGEAHANTLSPVCLTGANARLNVNITQAAMNAALAGTYTSTITIMVSPN